MSSTHHFVSVVVSPAVIFAQRDDETLWVRHDLPGAPWRPLKHFSREEVDRLRKAQSAGYYAEVQNGPAMAGPPRARAILAGLEGMPMVYELGNIPQGEEE